MKLNLSAQVLLLTSQCVASAPSIFRSELSSSASTSICRDRNKPWRIGGVKKNWCNWAKTNSVIRCKNKNLYKDCPLTCDRCPTQAPSVETTQAPSVEPTSTSSTALPCCGSLSSLIEKLDEKLDERFDSLDVRFQKMEERIEAIFDHMTGTNSPSACCPSAPPIACVEPSASPSVQAPASLSPSPTVSQAPIPFPSPFPTARPTSSMAPSAHPSPFPTARPTSSMAPSSHPSATARPTSSMAPTAPSPYPSDQPLVSVSPTPTCPTPTPLLPIISSGLTHVCAIDEFYTLFCWGSNMYGQVGAGNSQPQFTTPTAIQVANNPKELGLGNEHSCMIDVLSKIWCWGWNIYGQLGSGDNMWRHTPNEVSSMSVAPVKIDGGGMHTCIMNCLKKIWCWGWNTYGQLGTSTTSDSNTPIAVVGLSNDVSILSVGAFHNCVIDVLSQLSCWGFNGYGQIGLGHTTDIYTPTMIIFHVTEVSLGADHSCIINNLSEVWCWGYNQFGGLGDGTTTQRTTPTQTSLVTAALEIDLGDTHSCILDNFSDLWCWGSNWAGQLGLGDNSDKHVPTKVTAVLGGGQVRAGGYFTFLVDGYDNIMCMGANGWGQLGLGDTTHRNTPSLLVL